PSLSRLQAPESKWKPSHQRTPRKSVPTSCEMGRFAENASPSRSRSVPTYARGAGMWRIETRMRRGTFNGAQRRLRGLVGMPAGVNREPARLLVPAECQQTPTRSRDAASRLDDLSAREAEVLRLMAEGAANQEIAERLVVSIHTVKTHVVHILAKLQAANRTQAVARARASAGLAPAPRRYYAGTLHRHVAPVPSRHMRRARSRCWPLRVRVCDDGVAALPPPP